MLIHLNSSPSLIQHQVSQLFANKSITAVAAMGPLRQRKQKPVEQTVMLDHANPMTKGCLTTSGAGTSNRTWTEFTKI